MKCPKCGAELRENDRFCGSCGCRVGEQAPAANEAQTPEAVPQNPVPKKSHAKLIGIIAAVIAVAVIGAGAVLVWNNIRPDTEKQLVYVKDGILYYTGNMDKDKDPIEIYDGHEDDCIYDAKLSGDQQYLFFICGEDRSSRLYRVELQKLTANENKNDKYIEEIDSHVTSYDVYESGEVLYYGESGDFCYYDGKENTDIDGDVNSNFRFKDIIYYIKSSETEEGKLCYFDLGSKKVAEIDDCDSVVDYNENEVLYTRGESGDYDLYLAEIGKKPIKLAKEISQIESGDVNTGVIYYLRESGMQKTYYDFVEDPYAEEDEKAQEPDVKDYLTKSSPKKALSDYMYDDYREYKDSFYDYYCYYNDDYGMYVYYDYELDNGSVYYLIDKDKKTWSLFDYDAYDKACKAYEDVDERIQLRKSLKEKDFNITFYDLCCYTAKGGEKIVASAVTDCNAEAVNQICMYQKIEEENSKKVCSIDEIGYVSDVDTYLYEDETNEDQQYYMLVDGKEQKMDAAITDATFVDSDDGKTIMIVCYKEDVSELYAYENKSGELKKTGKVCSDYSYGFWDGDLFYYSTDDGDYCAYSNGKSKVILKDVESAYMPEEGIYTAYTDYHNETDNKLKIFNGKDEVLVDRDVYEYAYVNEKRIVYIKNGDLYVYRGEDKNRRIARDVSDFCCEGASEISW